MKLYVKVLCGSLTLCVRVGELRSIDSVKKQVMEKLKLPTDDDGRLYSAQCATGELKLMEPDKTIRHYGIRPYSIFWREDFCKSDRDKR